MQNLSNSKVQPGSGVRRSEAKVAEHGDGGAILRLFMRSTFSAFYPLPPADRTEVWRTGLIVPDANVLLNFYRYSDDTRDELFNALERHRQQLWVPHQAALEYHRGRAGVIQGE